MKKIIVFLITIAFIATFAYAGEEKKEKSFWDNLVKKMTRIVPKKKSRTYTTTAVGGVRGAKDESTDKLYWKDKEIEMNVSQEEIDKFNNAVSLAVDGKGKAAEKGFEEFLAAYPKSPLKNDAQSALKELRAHKSCSHSKEGKTEKKAD